MRKPNKEQVYIPNSELNQMKDWWRNSIGNNDAQKNHVIYQSKLERKKAYFKK